MRKILCLCMTYYPEIVGGAEVAIKEITDRIDPSDIEFHMVTLRMNSNLPKEERIGNVTVHRIGFAQPNPSPADIKKFPLHYNKLVYQFYAAWVAHRLHQKYRFDAVWSMMAHSTGVPGGLFKTLHPNVPYTLTLQEGDPPEYIEKLMRPFGPLFRRGFTTADRIQVISNFLGNWARKMGYRGDVVHIPNAVDTARFSTRPPETAVQKIKDSLGKKEGDVYLITTSRLVHKNAVDDVINALPLLPPHVHFVVCGLGADEAKLKALAVEKKVAERTHFTGRIEQPDLPAYLGACDIFIRASRSEGMGNSFIEAMAFGMPVIATQEGGIADFLFDEKRNPDKPTTGWAVDKDCPEQIAGATMDIISRPQKVEQVTLVAQQMALDGYDWELIAKRMRTEFFEPVLR
jgi:glycosyltransferase involved in cell wall biosynthesis